MLFFWGRHKVGKRIGAPEDRYCDICERERPFYLALTYDVSHVWGLFRWVSNKIYTMRCDICGRGPFLSRKDVEPKLAKDPIPFFDRLGWTIGLGAIAAFGVLIAIAIVQQNARDSAWVADPKVGDMYEIDIARMEKPPRYAQEYSLMRIVGFEGEKAIVLLGKTWCNKYGCAARDLENGAATRPDFYQPDAYLIPRADLPAMQKDGRITAVHRAPASGGTPPAA